MLGSVAARWCLETCHARTIPIHPPHPFTLLQIDRFLYSTDNQVVAGALLAVGIVNCGVMDEVDPAFALLSGG